MNPDVAEGTPFHPVASKTHPLDAPQRHQILHAWDDTVRTIPSAPFPALFEAQVAQGPDSVAIMFEGESLTYAQLNVRANRLAHVLLAEGTGPEQIVALMLPRSIDMIVAVLAVLKCGAAYLPLDPEYPAARLQFMIDDAAPVRLLTLSTLSERLSGNTPRLLLDSAETVQASSCASDANPASDVRLANNAYVIYTSGSTGRPKGVMVPHAGIANLAASQIERFAVTPQSRVLQFASISFDAAFSEVCLGLLSGACLVLAPAARLMPGDALIALIAETGVTHVTLPPSALAVLPPQSLPGVETLIVAGDACGASLVGQWAAGRRMINAYGPTETTVCAAMSEPLAEAAVPPLGRPNWNTRIYVLDDALEPVAPGVPGELYIAGQGVARGYLGRPDLTAERFVPDPFSSPGSRMYRTGDLASWRADGVLDFLGRIDHQVKIRGFRVEPGEVESVLTEHESVAQAAVIARHDHHGQQQLIGYAVAQGGVTLDPQALRAYLASRLPDYLVPVAIMSLDALPLTPNGKLDRQALPAVNFQTADSTAPRSAREKQLAALFAEVLGVEHVGMDDSFFLLGGHSLTATRLISRIRSTLDVALEMDDIFKTPTVAGLATRLADAPTAKVRPRMPLRRPTMPQ